MTTIIQLSVLRTGAPYRCVLHRGYRRELAVPRTDPPQRRCSTARSGSGEVRVRFAPSPTGFLHLGGLRTALYNFLFARKHGGSFILRLEDTDQSRLVPGAAQDIEDMLQWAGIPPDESPRRGGAYGPYLQSDRLALYAQAADRLLQTGHAYRCFCSPQRLDLLKREALRSGQTPRYDNRCRHLGPDQVQEKLSQGSPHVIRFRLEPGVEPFHDLVFGWTRHDVAQVEGDPVVVKGDGFPTYHLASVVDDNAMRVTHVLRGAEWLISAPKHRLLHAALGYEAPPLYAHLPLLAAADGNKLSKRRGDAVVKGYRERGCLPEALLDLLTHSGSGFSGNRMGRSLDELIAEFDPSRITTHSALLDLEKLPEFNRIHLQRRIEEPPRCDWLVGQLRGRVQQAYGGQIRDEEVLRPDYIARVLHLRKGHISGVEDLLGPEHRYLWVRPSLCAQQVAALTSEAQLIITLALRLVSERGAALSVESLGPDLRRLSEETSVTKYRDAMKLLRLSLSGLQQGPSVAEMMVSLGASEVTQRFQNLLRQLDHTEQ